MSVLDYLPTEYMRARASEWVGDPRPEERPSEALLRACRAARDAGDRTIGHALWDAWFRARCAEGRPPDMLRANSSDPAERFWACVVEGPDGHWFWNGKTSSGRPVTRARDGDSHDIGAQRFSWILRHGSIRQREDVWSTCGEAWCLNPDHLAYGWQPRNQHMYSPEQLIGALQVCAKQLGHVPTRREYQNWRPRKSKASASSTPTETIILRRIGPGWQDALRSAGLA